MLGTRYANMTAMKSGNGVDGNPRMTRDDLKTLKTISKQEQPGKKMIATFKSQIERTLSALFAVKPPKVNSMCKYYGHVIRGSWSGHLPKCADCGSMINGPHELRKANPQR